MSTDKSINDLSGEYNFMQTINDNFLFQHCKENTRHRENQISTLIDLVLSNEEQMVSDSNT